MREQHEGRGYRDECDEPRRRDDRGLAVAHEDADESCGESQVAIDKAPADGPIALPEAAAGMRAAAQKIDNYRGGEQKQDADPSERGCRRSCSNAKRRTDSDLERPKTDRHDRGRPLADA